MGVSAPARRRPERCTAIVMSRSTTVEGWSHYGMPVSNVWIRDLSDRLVCADQITPLAILCVEIVRFSDMVI